MKTIIEEEQVQEVYHDGTGGIPIGFKNQEQFMKALAKAEVDRVEVFNEGSEAHKRAIRRIEDPKERKKAWRKLRKKVAKK